MTRIPLPDKTCTQCNRPFSWRRKWRRDWDAVRYCSERCRRAAGATRWRERTGSGCDQGTGAADR